MVANTQNRLMSAAGLALAAGLMTVAAPAARADFDWGFSLNLGWCSPDPYCAPVPVCNSFGGYWADPCPPAWGWRPWCRPSWGGFWAPTFYTPLWTAPGSSFAFSYFSGGSGFAYTSTTFYSPYHDYYQPAWQWGLSFSYSNFNNNWGNFNGCNGGGWNNGGHWNNGGRNNIHDNVTIINNGGTVNIDNSGNTTGNGNGAQPLNGRGGLRQAQGVPRVQPPVGPVVPAAESFGIAGPPATPEALTSKGPNRVTPVGVKPIGIDSSAQKPTSVTGEKPGTIAGKPVQTPSKPVLPMLQQTPKPSQYASGKTPASYAASKPRAPSAREGTIAPTPVVQPSSKPAQYADAKTPASYTASKPRTPSPREGSTAPVIGKTPTTTPYAAPSMPVAKPIDSGDKPASLPTPSSPRTAPQPTRTDKPSYTPAQTYKPTPAPAQAPSAPAARQQPAQSGKPTFTPAPAPRQQTAPAPRQQSAPSAKPTYTPAPAPRMAPPAPAPSAAPRMAPSMPAGASGGMGPSGKPVDMGGGGKRR